MEHKGTKTLRAAHEIVNNFVSLCSVNNQLIILDPRYIFSSKFFAVSFFILTFAAESSSAVRCGGALQRGSTYRI